MKESETKLKDDKEIELIKASIVKGENIIPKMIETTLAMEKKVVTIRDVNIKVDKINTEVIEDKVLIEGRIIRQIFYVGEDDVIHYQEHKSEFNEFIIIPGAEPQMDAFIETTVEYVGNKIIEEKEIEQRVVLQFFVKLLSKKQLYLETGQGPLIKAERIIGENTVQTLLENTVILEEPAQKIIDISADVRNLEFELLSDEIIIEGIIEKELSYINKNNLELKTTQEISFSKFVDIPSIEKGMQAAINPLIKNIDFQLKDGGKTVVQEIVLDLDVEITKSSCLKLCTGSDSLVMLPEVIGENTGQVMKESTIILDNPIKNVENIDLNFEKLAGIVIDDMVLIQGIICKDIYYTGKDNFEYYHSEKSSFSSFLEVVGARPGMKEEILGNITPVKSDINDNKLTQKIIIELFVVVTEDIQFKVSEPELSGES